MSRSFFVVVRVHGPEISFGLPSRFGLQDREVSLAEIQGAVAATGSIAPRVSIRGKTAEGVGIELNPDRNKRWILGNEDEVLILSNPGTGGAGDCQAGKVAQAEPDFSGRSE
jgi:hypothetical protein